MENVFAKDASKRFGGWLIRLKGMQVEFKAFETMGKRVEKVTIGDQPIDLNRQYILCASEREGDLVDMLCRMKGIQEGTNTSFTSHSMLKEYLKEFSPITPTLRHDAKILDAPQDLLSQVSGVDYKFV